MNGEGDPLRGDQNWEYVPPEPRDPAEHVCDLPDPHSFPLGVKIRCTADTCWPAPEPPVSHRARGYKRPIHVPLRCLKEWERIDTIFLREPRWRLVYDPRVRYL